MSRYIARLKTRRPDPGLFMACYFLVMAGLMFASSVALKTGSQWFDVGRQLAAHFGWSSTYVSQAMPPQTIVMAMPLKTVSPSVETTLTAHKPPEAIVDDSDESEIIPALIAELEKPETPSPRQEPSDKIAATKQKAVAPAEPQTTRQDAEQLAALPVPPRKPARRSDPVPPDGVVMKPKTAPIETLMDPELTQELAALRSGDTDKPAVEPEPKLENPVEAPAPPAPPAQEKFDVAALIKKAEAGEAKAQLELAQRYQTGMGVPVQAIKAVHWYRRAAEQGELEAQFNLGMMYYLGDGTPKNLALAYRLISFAANEGNQRAKAVLNTFNRILPASVFTAMVFPEPIVLEAPAVTAQHRIKTVKITPKKTPIRAPVETQTVMKKMAAAPSSKTIRENMTTSSYWKPNVYLLGHQPLR